MRMIHVHNDIVIMSQSSEKESPKAFKIVREALLLDAENKSKEAYVHYLRSVSLIANTMYQNADGGNNIDGNHVKKLVSVAKHCLERIEILAEKLSGTSNPQQSPHEATTSPDTRPTITKSQSFNVAIVIPQTNVSSLPLSNPREFRNLDPDILRNSWTPGPSPMERALNENQCLVNMYKSRLAKVASPVAKANVTLELQRRLSENLQVARTKQVVYIRQMQERRQRLLDEAVKKIGKTSSLIVRAEEKIKEIYASILEYEQNEMWPAQLRQHLKESQETGKNTEVLRLVVHTTLSNPDHPLCNYFQSLLNHIYDKTYPLVTRSENFRNQLGDADQKPKSPPLALNSKILPQDSTSSCKDFRMDCDDNNFLSSEEQCAGNVEVTSTEETECLAQMKNDKPKSEKRLVVRTLKKLQDLNLGDSERSRRLKTDGEAGQELRNISNEVDHMEEDALERHLINIVQDVHDGVTMLSELFDITFERCDQMSKRLDDWYQSVEESFLEPLWPIIMRLFRLVNCEEEEMLRHAMSYCCHLGPVDVGVSGGMNCEGVEDEARYLMAAKELLQIFQLFHPPKKLSVLVNTIRILCNEGESVPKRSDEMKSIGADDLIPMLAYTIARCGKPELVSECHALNEFVPEKCLMGEEGYCLTSVLTAIHYLGTLVPPSNSMVTEL